MAGNTYRKTENKKRQGKKGKFSLKKVVDDRRVQLTTGLFLVFLGVCMFLAFTSYLFTGNADQSIIEGGNVYESGLEAKNWLGYYGALLSHWFVFKWFGVAAFLFVPILVTAGYGILFRQKIKFFGSLVSASIFFLFWTSTTFGYYYVTAKSISSYGFLSGGIGFEIAATFYSWFGWGTVFLLFFTLAVFLIFFFNITSLIGLGKSTEDEELVEDDDHERIKDEHKNFVQELNDELLTNAEELSEENKEEEATEITIDSELAANDEDRSNQAAVEDTGITFDHNPDDVQPQPKTDPDEELEIDVSEAEEEETVKDTGALGTNYDPTLDLAEYQYPTLELLEDRSGGKISVTREELEANKDKIVNTLGNYKIGISSIKATIGPTVTLYEIVPEAGIKISKIKNLEDDIALGLAALGIRIIAPIPGKGTIGIEVPNKNREMVSIRSVISTEKFAKSEMDLPIVLGKTISNEVFMIDLAKMPHVLMAGATGQGKSVGINVLLTSLLYKKHPSQLKFVLVDPKKVELSIYTTIEKHFLAKLPDSEESIITDTKKVVHTLNALCIEMDTRYTLLKNAGCRNLKEYNKKFIERKLNPNHGHQFMPYIVVVIDELADLMMTAGKEVESPIARLAQLARAIGIHLVVATQRPSVNVITGVIKANFPARVSFKVTSKVDSRTILDAGGADQLIGMGDMLFSQGSDIIRVQCAFVDTPEVDAICDFIGDQRGYESAFLLPEYIEESESGIGDVDLSDRDAMFDDAARIIVQTQQGSTSMLQRKLKLGYNRAGRLIDQLEAAGIVGPFEGSKAREVLVKDEYALEQLLNDLNSN